MAAVVPVLERGQALGLLGPAPVRQHVDHSVGFTAGVDQPPERFLDLGSGGGVPGLVLALTWPGAQAVLLDAGERRCAFLRQAVDDLALGPRVTVVRERAELAGRDRRWRATFDLVVARSFGRPAVTAECGAPFLRVGGRLVVSEPPLASVDEPLDDGLVSPSGEPGDVGAEGGVGAPGAACAPGAGSDAGGASESARWPGDALARLGLGTVARWHEPFSYQALVQREICPDRYPRRVGVVAKRHLF
jgi:16S rRNA (guanine527-N7)-methyltransferase